MDQGSLGIASGLGATVIAISTLGVGQWNRYQDRRNAKQKELEDDAAQAPDLSVKRLSEALNRLNIENERIQHDLDSARDRLDTTGKHLNQALNDLARMQSKFQGSIEDRDSMIGENSDLHKQVEDLRTQWNEHKNKP